MHTTFYLQNQEQLPEVAQKVLQVGKGYPIWILQGAMGAGKTTLIKHICEQLGVVDVVSSPTYSLVNEYQTKTGQTVYHFDLYRIQSLAEALDMGLEDYLTPSSLCLIEWADLVRDYLPDPVLVLSIDIHSDQTRTLSIEAP